MKIRFSTQDYRPTVILQPYSRQNRKGPARLFLPAALVVVCIICIPFGFFYALTTPFLIVPLATPLAALAMIVLWAMPDVRRKPLSGLETLLFSFLCAIIVWPNYIALSLPGLPWITVARLFMFPLTFIFLLSLATSGEFRAKLGDIQRNSIHVWKFILAIFIIQLITIPLSPDIAGSIQKTAIWQINLTCTFFVSAYIFSKAGRVDQWLLMLLVSCLILAVIGIIEGVEQKVLWAGHLPSFLSLDTESIGSILEGATRTATGLYRVKGTSSTPLGLSEIIALSMPFIIHMTTARFSLLVRGAAMVAVPALIIVVLGTDSRLGVVGTLIAFLLYFAFWAVMRWRRRPADLFAPAVLFLTPAVLGAGFAATFFIRRLQLKVWGGGAQNASNAAREAQMNSGLPIIFKNPIGHGSGQAAETLGYRNAVGTLTIDNYFLSIGLEYGVIGFIAFYGMFGYAAYHSALQAMSLTESSPREFDLFVPLSISLFSFVVIKTVFSQQDNHPLVFMMLGMVVALTYRYRATLREDAPQT